MIEALPRLSDYPSAEERWLAAVAVRLDTLVVQMDRLLAAVAPPAPAPGETVLLQEPRRRGRPRDR